MIKFEDTEVGGWIPAIKRGMRNPKNSWHLSDSDMYYPNIFVLGQNDKRLAMTLAKGGAVHAKYRRMITVWVDITAPLYWWKEFDTYKVGTVSNSCSTMHKIHSRPLTIDDFSVDYIPEDSFAMRRFRELIDCCNDYRQRFIDTGDKTYWDILIQLLPSSYNQKRTIQLDYETLASIYKWRKNHKLAEWRKMCRWIEELPYSELITVIEDIPPVTTFFEYDKSNEPLATLEHDDLHFEDYSHSDKKVGDKHYKKESIFTRICDAFDTWKEGIKDLFFFWKDWC